jgi:hypothetical protein
MASRFDKGAILGLTDTKTAFRAVDPVLRDHLNDATEETVRVIAMQARQAVRRRFGILAQHIQWTMSRATGIGKVGIGPRETVALPSGRGTEIPTQIAHNVEFGHGGPHPAPAHPFLLPAAEGEQAHYLTRVHQAGRAAEDQLAARNYATGGGLL